VTIVEVTGLSRHFAGYTALENVSFKIPAGSFLAIIGPNGAGKSVLIRTLMGLEAPSSGYVSICGMSPTQLPAKAVAYVPQMKTINRSFPATAVEVVATGTKPRWPFFCRGQAREEALDALSAVGASALADKQVRELSGGELQRVLLARSFVRRPQILLLDEPGTGIDNVGEADMYELIERAHQQTGVTVIMVSHDLQAALHHASHVLLLHRKVIAFGPAQSTLTNDNLALTFGHYRHHHSMGV
jgi:zinc transport system ATP-binding protein